MSPSSRAYHSPRREREASRTRQEILDTARELFTAHGYARVTMAEIAQSAGTALKTLYASVGTKTQILHTLIADDVAGSRDPDIAVEVLRAPDLESAVALVARTTRVNTERFRQSIDLLFSSMASDDGAREAWEHAVAQCRAVLRKNAGCMIAAGLVEHLDVDDVADRLWFCFGLSAWRTLVVECGWTFDKAERLLGRNAIGMLRAGEA
jgi:AcrR family transcriptional regulator